MAGETYSFGEWVKRRRVSLRLTMRELAGAVHCSLPMLKKIEADQRRASPELARLLAAALRVPAGSHEAFVAAARGERTVEVLWPLAAAEDPAGWQPYVHAPLPRPATDFIGREQELVELGQLLAQAGCRLLTLLGPGGMGKTRLALAAAEAYGAAVPLPATHLAVFVPLAAVTDAARLPDAVANSLRLTLSGPPAEQVISFLRRRQALLILDNCEQVQGDLAWLSDLLAQAPDVRLMATSRVRLRLAEEWVYTVPGLAQAAALFAKRARRLQPGFDAGAEAATIARICALVENMPLAVELAAGWVPVLTCAQIAAHLAQDFGLLTTDLSNVPERQRSLQAVCDHAWRLLTAPEQAALRRLAVFRGGWQPEQAQAAAGADLHQLRQLTDKSLVRRNEGGRFELHEFIRQDAARRLVEAGEEPSARRAHFEAYLALAAQLHAAQFGPDAMAAIVRLDQERANLRAALEWGLEAGEVDAALELHTHLTFYWARRGAYREGGEWTQRLLSHLGDRESVPACLSLSSAAVFSFMQGRFEAAEALAQRTLAMARRLEAPEALVSAYGLATFAATNVDDALAGLRTAIRLSEETGAGRELRPLLYNGAATWLHSSGRYAEARASFEKSLALFRELGAVDFVSEPLARLGQLALQEGRLAEARDLTLESLAAAQATGQAVVYGAWGLARLGQIQLYLGELELAQQSLETALAQLQDDPAYRRDIQETLALLSEAALARGDVPAAVEHLRGSLQLAEQFFRELSATAKLEGTADSLPVDLVSLCARAALVAAAQGLPARAVTLCGVAGGLAARSGLNLVPPLQARVEAALAGLRPLLGDAAFEAAWAAGQRLSSAEAFAYLVSAA